MKDKIVDADTLQQIVFEGKKSGKKIAATSGCFDILHAGHVIYLEAAASMGDIFILFLNSDNSVRKLKSDKRPIVPEQERAIVISGLACIDYICIFDETTPCQIINKVKPDCFIKGGDYKGKWIPEMDVMEQVGGKVEYVLMIDGYSTTNIIEKILKLNS